MTGSGTPGAEPAPAATTGSEPRLERGPRHAPKRRDPQRDERLASYASFGEALAALDRLVRRGVPRDQLYICAIDLLPVRPDRSGPSDLASASATLGAAAGLLVAGGVALYDQVDPIVPGGLAATVVLLVAGLLLGGVAGLLTALGGARRERAGESVDEPASRAARYELYAGGSITVLRAPHGAQTAADADNTIDLRDGAAGDQAAGDPGPSATIRSLPA